MEQDLKKFGVRLRRLIDERGLALTEFAERYGLTESQLHNWLKRDDPPLAKHWDKLASFFKVDRSVIIGSDTQYLSEPHIGEATQAPYGDAAGLKREIQSLVAEAVQAAGNDVGRLGWIREQLLRSIAVPEHWEVHERALADALARREKEREEKTRDQESSPKATQLGAG